MSDSDISRKIIIYITYIMILYIIIEELYYLTSFVYSYNTAYDYGLMLKNMCNNEYFEYETERFQLYNNIVGLRLDNDKYNKKNYMTMVLVLSLVIGIIISFVFANLFYHNFIEDYKNCTKFDSGNGEYSSFKQIILCFCPMCGDLSDCTLSYLIYIFLLILIPLYLLLKLGFNIDFDLFTNNPYKNYLIAIIILLFILRLPIKKLDDFRFLNINSSYFIYYLYLIIYIMIFYYICNIIKIYNDYNDIYNERLDNKELNDEDKFYDDYSKDIIEGIPDEKEVDIYNNFISNVIGLNGFDQQIFDETGVFIKDYSKFIIIIGIILIIIYILYLCIFKFKFLTSLIKSENDYKIMYNKLIIPGLSLFIIILITNGTSLYNSYINKYVLYEPLKLYKNDLDKLYKSFDSIIINDSSTLNDPKPVCQNVANAILTVLYSNIFEYNIATGLQNSIKTLLIGNKYSKTIIPKFNYIADCNSSDLTNFDNDKYDILKLFILDINDILMIDDYRVFRNILLNIYPSIIYKISKDILDSTDTGISNIRSISVVAPEVVNLREEIILNIRAAISNVMVLHKNPQGNDNLISNNNINKLSNKNFYIKNSGNRNNDKNYYKDDKRFNKLLNNYDNLIEKVAEEYIKYIAKICQLINEIITKLTSCNIIPSTTPPSSNTIVDESLLATDNLITKLEKVFIIGLHDENNKKILKRFSDNFKDITKASFDNINVILSSNQTDRTVKKLTNYIISNYNNINIDKMYNKKDFVSIATPSKIAYDNANSSNIDILSTTINTKETAFDTAKNNYDDDPSILKNSLLQTAINELNDAKKALSDLYKPIIEGDLSSDPNFGDEKRAKTIGTNAQNMSLCIVAIYIIYLFTILEPYYIESFDKS